MKKVLATILAIVYLSTSMGATVHLHYCMGRLVSWGLIEHEGKNCDFCGMQKASASEKCTVSMNHCCHEISKQLRNDKDQKTGSEFFQLIKVSLAMASLPRPIWENALVVSPALSSPVANAPPPVITVPVFLRVCNFRI